MSRLQIELPTIQNWNCHNCSGCCKQHGIFITAEEKRRIESQHWEQTELCSSSAELIIESRGWFGRRVYRLAQQADGSCVFLDEKGLCRIHGKFGEPAKPLACRIYPYAFHPKGHGVVVSLRYSCPSVTKNLGESVARQRQEIREIAELVVPETARGIPAPRITGNTQLEWTETLTIIDRIDQTLSTRHVPIGLKLLRTLVWLDLIRQTQFTKIRGERIGELLDLIVPAAEHDLPVIPEPVQPSKVALMQFRLLAGQYARKDTFASADLSLRGRWRQLQSALKLTSGTGSLPSLNEQLGEVPVERLEGSFGPLPEESEELLNRYFRVKVQGMHFCGPAFYGMNLVEGFQSLALVLPVVLWIARWRAVTQSRSEITAEDVREALQIVDHQHGYSDVFGTWGSKRRVTTLAQSGQLLRLITWYGQ